MWWAGHWGRISTFNVSTVLYLDVYPQGGVTVRIGRRRTQGRTTQSEDGVRILRRAVAVTVKMVGSSRQEKITWGTQAGENSTT